MEAGHSEMYVQLYGSEVMCIVIEERIEKWLRHNMGNIS